MLHDDIRIGVEPLIGLFDCNMQRDEGEKKGLHGNIIGDLCQALSDIVEHSVAVRRYCHGVIDIVIDTEVVCSVRGHCFGAVGGLRMFSGHGRRKGK